MEQSNRAVWKRGDLMFFGVLVLLGLALLMIAMSLRSDFEARRGSFVIATQEEFDAFARCVVLNELGDSDYTVQGEGIPYIIYLDAVVKKDADFPYGDVHTIAVWGEGTATKDIARMVMIVFGPILLLVAGGGLCAVAIWPKLTTHKLKITGEWIPSKEKGIPDANPDGIEG